MIQGTSPLLPDTQAVGRNGINNASEMGSVTWENLVRTWQQQAGKSRTHVATSAAPIPRSPFSPSQVSAKIWKGSVSRYYCTHAVAVPLHYAQLIGCKSTNESAPFCSHFHTLPGMEIVELSDNSLLYIHSTEKNNQPQPTRVTLAQIPFGIA